MYEIVTAILLAFAAGCVVTHAFDRMNHREALQKAQAEAWEYGYGAGCIDDTVGYIQTNPYEKEKDK